MVTGTGDGAAIENCTPVRSIRVDGPATWRRSILSMKTAARMFIPQSYRWRRGVAGGIGAAPVLTPVLALGR